MNLHVPSILPRSTLTPLALQHKFLRAGVPVGFAGLGDCLVYDETGACLVDDGSGSTLPTTGAPCPGSPGCPGYVAPLSDVQVWAESGTSPYIDSQGNLILPSAGGYTGITPSGQSRTATGSPPTASSGSITPQQAQMYASIISSLSNAGTRIAAITSLPAGATLLPNGAIIGAGQQYGGVNQSLASLFSGPILPILLVVGLALIASR